MASVAFDTKIRGAGPDAIAPDGAEVRILCATMTFQLKKSLSLLTFRARLS